MSVPYHVVITDLIDDDLAPEREALGDVARVTALRARSEAQLAGRIEQADALIVYHLISLTPATIGRLEKCRIIVRGGVGFDNVDHAFARERGIPVANTPDYGTEDVADSAIGMLLSLARGIHLANSRLREGREEWTYAVSAPLARLRGRTLGIVGLGRIGTACAVRGKAFGMDVAFYDPYKPDGYDKALGVRRVETLNELLGQSLAVSLHCPLTEETHHMIDAQAIEAMPRGSYLVNTARGGVVDTGALPDALASGRLAGAAIDVLEQEPPPPDDPLLAAWRDPGHPAHDRLILNPHLAWYCEEGWSEVRRKSAETCRRALLGLPLRNIVN
ncbi:MAG: C-terminal binding protein [Candidatus Sumerlaeota bacterium]|nr:C-terminal binding protein [Candidatus Sumerlaeota bacterium]